MAAVMVRCPKCGAPNPDDPRRARRCSACHEPLGKCRYCQAYDPRLLDCTSLYRPQDQHISDPDEVRDCPHFRSRLSAQRRRDRRAILRTTAIALALIAAGGLLALRLSHPAGQLSSALPFRPSIAAPETSVQDEGFDLQVVLFNPTEEPVRGIQVVVTGPRLRQLTCQWTDPPESFVEQSRRTVMAAIGDLGPAEHSSLVFHFLAAKTGSFALTVHLTAASAAGADAYELETEVVP